MTTDVISTGESTVCVCVCGCFMSNLQLSMCVCMYICVHVILCVCVCVCVQCIHMCIPHYISTKDTVKTVVMAKEPWTSRL